MSHMPYVRPLNPLGLIGRGGRGKRVGCELADRFDDFWAN